MSDKPKPGKDKDLRYVRQAIAEADTQLRLLGALADQAAAEQVCIPLTEAMLVVIEQMDVLDQMLSDSMATPAQVIEYNRQLRGVIRICLQQQPTWAYEPRIIQLVRSVGDQLRALLVIKEIRLLH